MKRSLLAGALLIAALLALPVMPALAAKETPVRIGVIDVQRILREAKAVKSVRDVFLKDLDTRRIALTERSDKVRQMEKEIKDAEKRMSAAEKKEKNEKLAREVKELKRLGSDFNEEMKKKNVELTRKLIGEIRDVARTFARNEGFTVIMEKGTLFAADEAADVTDKIIKLYDAQKR